jgi:thiamine biosynthesis lipoprotein
MDGLMLDLGAIGKGYAIDRAVDLLRDAGVQQALIHGGTSSIYGLGPGPDGSPWKVAVGQETVELLDSSLSISSSHGRTAALSDRSVGHIIDPRTGEPSPRVSTAVVTGPSAAITDALSTAVVVLGPGQVIGASIAPLSKHAMH